MKVFFLFVMFISCYVFSSDSVSHISKNAENVDFFLSFPRSGTNWTIAIMQFHTKREVRWLHCNLRAHNRLDVALVPTKKPIFRTHKVEPILYMIDSSKNSLLMVLRNYKECILRNCTTKSEPRSLFVSKDFINSVEIYKNNIKFFDDWRGRKLLIYYEDLITSPEREIRRLLNHLNESPKLVSNFMKNYNTYKNLCVKSYHSQHSQSKDRKGSLTKGEHVLFHSKNWGKAFLKEFDGYMKKDFPLYQKYLGRFEEK